MSPRRGWFPFWVCFLVLLKSAMQIATWSRRTLLFFLPTHQIQLINSLTGCSWIAMDVLEQDEHYNVQHGETPGTGLGTTGLHQRSREVLFLINCGKAMFILYLDKQHTQLSNLSIMPLCSHSRGLTCWDTCFVIFWSHLINPIRLLSDSLVCSPWRHDRAHMHTLISSHPVLQG